MDGRKILLCTTFREFNGNSNDKIQRLFLDSIKRQTYQSYELAITTFGEKNVGKTLQEYRIPHSIWSSDAGQYRFSLTEVVENTLSLVNMPERYIVIWTTCDVILPDTFFETIVKKLPKKSSGTSYPHVIYKNIENFEKRKGGRLLFGGLDTIFFDADILCAKEVHDAIRTYPNKGWGYFEFFLTAIGMIYSKRMINIWPEKINKIDNDRGANKETQQYFDLGTSHNSKMTELFLRRHGIKPEYYKFFLQYKFLYSSILIRTRIRFFWCMNRTRRNIRNHVKIILKKLRFI